MKLNKMNANHHVRLEAPRVNGRRQIMFPANFARMRELLATIETAIKSNGWFAMKLREIVSATLKGIIVEVQGMMEEEKASRFTSKTISWRGSRK